MRRGFKAEAERLAVRLRTELDIKPDQHLDVDRGLSEETRVDVEEGVLVIADDDPQAEILKDMTGTEDGT
jgi:hypothetical protein